MRRLHESVGSHADRTIIVVDAPERVWRAAAVEAYSVSEFFFSSGFRVIEDSRNGVWLRRTAASIAGMRLAQFTTR